MAAEPGMIEVGAADGTLRFWLAQEAVRLGELVLAGQAAALASQQARAASITTWSTGALFAGAAWLAHTPAPRLLLVPATLLALAALCCAAAFWPRRWHHAGYTWSELAARACGSALEHLELTAAGYETAARANRRFLRRFGGLLRAAWALFIMAAVTAAALAVTGAA